MRLLPALVAVALATGAGGCAGGDDTELAALRAEVEQRRQAELAAVDRMDELEHALATMDEAIERMASATAVEQLHQDVEELRDRTSSLDNVIEDLEAATSSVAELEAAVTAGTSERTELDDRLDAVAGELGAAIATLRGTVTELEGDTAGVSDQLVALRNRVDVIQRQLQGSITP